MTDYPIKIAERNPTAHRRSKTEIAESTVSIFSLGWKSQQQKIPSLR